MGTDDRAFTLVGGEVGGAVTSLRIDGGLITGMGGRPASGERRVDLDGARVLPGLINAHDHLQLNSLPPLSRDAPWRNARQWIADVDARRRGDRDFAARVNAPRNRRLLAGALKNLLCGVTTVAHHDPLYEPLLAAGFPVAVVRYFGWSHSLGIDGEERVRCSHERTPREWPWIIHAAEGTDDEAAAEFDTLAALGCITARTCLVHGVGLSDAQVSRLDAAGASLIWCPSSNLSMFDRTVCPSSLLPSARVALGTDSRLTGARDLLDELRIARDRYPLDTSRWERMVTADVARMLRLADRGRLQAGTRADLVVLPAERPLVRCSRADLRLVVAGGVPCLADPDLGASLAPPSAWVPVRLDGRPKLLGAALASALRTDAVDEPGLELPWMEGRAA